MAISLNTYNEDFKVNNGNKPLFFASAAYRKNASSLTLQNDLDFRQVLRFPPVVTPDQGLY